VLLVHGIDYRDGEQRQAWGRIPNVLRSHGASVYISRQDAWGRAQSNALQLADEIRRVLKASGTTRVNIIAHSKGGVDSRILATLPEMAGKVASITTIASPNRGISALNWVSGVSDLPKRAISTVFDIARILSGDTNPAFFWALEDISADSMRNFDAHYPLPDDVFLQSFSTIRHHFRTDLLFALPWLIVLFTDGPNDGLVPVGSTAIGRYGGVINEHGRWGLSHIDVLDRSFFGWLRNSAQSFMGRKQTARNRDGFDILDWWVDMVANLKDQGL
jgi:triacylglycerol lipase